MKKMVAGWTAAVVLLASAGSLVAHHGLSQYDTTTAVRVKGTIVVFERVNPHSILFVDQKREDGQIQRWAVEGPGILQLDRMGLGKEALKAGVVVEACGYVVTKEGGKLRQANVLREQLRPIAIEFNSVSGRIMDGELLVMADGQKRIWSDYGHHKCLSPDYVDFHTR